jgi:hypothetical protein
MLSCRAANPVSKGVESPHPLQITDKLDHREPGLDGLDHRAKGSKKAAGVEPHAASRGRGSKIWPSGVGRQTFRWIVAGRSFSDECQ